MSTVSTATSNTATKPLSRGRVTAIRGSVIDVYFQQQLPTIHTMLSVGETNQVKIEVLEQQNAHNVRCIALTPTQGIARGMYVLNSGKPLLAPVGKHILSRMFGYSGLHGLIETILS